MIDEQGPQGSPDDAGTADPSVDLGTAVDWDSPENTWKTRFETYRVEADRRNTQLSQYEQALEDFRSGDPSAMRRAAAILKVDDLLEIPDPEPETFDDPYDALAAKLEALEGKLSQGEQQRQQENAAMEVEKRLSKIDGLDDADKDLVLARAIAMPPGADGLPDVQAAYKALVDRDTARMQQYEADWRAGKRAPTSIQPGTTATQKRNPEDLRDSSGQLTAEGLDYYAQRAEDRSA